MRGVSLSIAAEQELVQAIGVYGDGSRPPFRGRLNGDRSSELIGK